MGLGHPGAGGVWGLGVFLKFMEEEAPAAPEGTGLRAVVGAHKSGCRQQPWSEARETAGCMPPAHGVPPSASPPGGRPALAIPRPPQHVCWGPHRPEQTKTSTPSNLGPRAERRDEALWPRQVGGAPGEPLCSPALATGRGAAAGQTLCQALPSPGPAGTPHPTQWPLPGPCLPCWRLPRAPSPGPWKQACPEFPRFFPDKTGASQAACSVHPAATQEGDSVVWSRRKGRPVSPARVRASDPQTGHT